MESETAAAEQKIQQLAQKGAEVLGSVGVEVNWDFTKAAKFTAQSEDNRKTLVRYLADSFVERGLLKADDGLVAWLKKSPSGSAVQQFQKSVKCIRVQVNPENSVEAKTGNSYYQIRLQGDVLLVTVRLDSIRDGDGWGPKTDLQLGFHVLDEASIHKTAAKLPEMNDKIKAALPDCPDVEIDWSFTESEEFRKTSDSTRNNQIEQLVSSFIERGALDKQQGLAAWLMRSQRATKAFLDRTKKIVVKVNPQNSCDSQKGNSYYQIRFEADAMVVTVRRDSINDGDGWGIKVDHHLDLQVQNEEWIEKAEKELEKFNAKWTEAGYATPISVDWSYTKSDRFKKSSDRPREKMITDTVQRVLDRGLFSDGSKALHTWLSQSERAKTQFSENVASILIKANPENSVDAKKGNSYYQIRNEAGVLTVTLRMDSLSDSDGWGPKVDNCMQLYVQQENWMRQQIPVLEQLTAKFDAAMGRHFEIVADFDSFVQSERFLKCSESTQEKYIKQLVTVHIEKGLFSSNKGVVAYCQKSERWRNTFLNSVNRFVIKVAPENSCDAKIGNSYFQLRVLPDTYTVEVLARLDSVDTCDGYGYKLDYHLKLFVEDELAVVAASKSVAEAALRLKSVGIAATVEVDWSFLDHQRFMACSESSRKSYITKLGSTVVQGVTELAKDAADVVTGHVGCVRIKVMPDNSLPHSSRVGSSYYTVDYAGGILTFTYRLDSVDTTGGWAEKIKAIASDVAAGPATPQGEPLKEHPYLAPPPTPAEVPSPLVEEEALWLRPVHLDPEAAAKREARLAEAKAKAAEIAAAKKKKEEELAAKRAKQLAELAEKRAKQQAELAKRRAERQAQLEAARAAKGGAKNSNAAPGPSTPLAVPMPQEDHPEAPNDFKSALRSLADKLRSLGLEHVEVTCDFGFADEEPYKSLSDSEKSKRWNNLKRGVGCVQSALTAAINNDKTTIAKQTLEGEVSSVLFAVDPTNSVSDPMADSQYAKGYTLELAAGFLIFTNNIDNSDFEEISQKVALVSGVVLPALEAQLVAKLEQLESKLSSESEVVLALEQDFSFMADELFNPQQLLTKHQREWSDFFDRLYRSHWETVVGHIKRLCKNSTVFKEMFTSRFSRFIVSLDMANQIADGTDRYEKVYKYEEEPTGTLRLSFNCNIINNAYYQTPKLEELVAARTDEEILKTNEFVETKLKEHQNTTGRSLEVEIGYDELRNAPKYQEMLNPKKSEVFDKLRRSIVGSMFSNSILSSRAIESDEVLKNTLYERVQKVHFTVDPEDSVQDGNGDYTKHYIFKIEGGVLHCRVNFSKVSEGLYEGLEKLQDLLDVVVLQQIRDGDAVVQKAADNYKNAVASDLELKLHWDTFVECDKFLTLPRKDKEDKCQKMARLLKDVADKLAYMARNDVDKKIFQQRVKSVHMRLDPTEAQSDPIFTTDYVRHYLVTHDEASGRLDVVLNYDKALADGVYNLSVKLEYLFDLPIERHKADKFPKLLQEIKDAATVPATIEWALFEEVPEYRDESNASKKAEQVTNLLNTVRDNFKKHEKWEKEWPIISRSLKGLKLVIDPKNGVSDRYEHTDYSDYNSHYMCRLDDAGICTLTVNDNNLRETLYGLKVKLAAQARFVHAKLVTCEEERSKCEKELQQLTKMTNFSLAIEWSSFQLDTMWKLTDAEQDTVVERINLFLRVLVAGVADSCATPPGLAAFQKGVQRALLRHGHDSSGEETLIADGTLTAQYELKKFKQDPWNQHEERDGLRQRINWILRSTVPVEKYEALKRIEVQSQRAAEALGQACPVTVDWTYVESAQFRADNTADEAEAKIRRLSGKFVNNIVGGLCSVTNHPVGLNSLKQSVSSVLLIYDPKVDLTQRAPQASLLKISPQGQMSIAFGELEHAGQIEYKERIEFELDLVVKIAFDRAQEALKLTEKQLSEATGNNVVIDVQLSGFVAADPFKWQTTPANQRKIVKALADEIPRRMLADAEDSALAVLQTEHGKKHGSVKKVEIALATGADSPYAAREGGVQWEAATQTLRLTFHIGNVLTFSKWRNWKARFADVFGVLLAIAQDEVKAKVEANATQLASEVGRATPLEIDWKSFVETAEWRALPPADRYERLYNLAGFLMRDILMGYDGLPGPLEFPPVKEKVLAAVSRVQFKVDAKLLEYTVAPPKDGVLVITLPLSLLAKSATAGCRYKLESAMKLKPLVEKCTQEWVQAKQIDPVRQTLKSEGLKIESITLDWESLTKSELYLKNTNYVEHMRLIGTYPKLLFLESEGIGEWLDVKAPAAHKALLDKIRKLRVVIDPSSTVTPDQKRYVPWSMKLATSGDELVVTVREDFERVCGRGCGLLVEYLLTPTVAADKVDRWLTALAQDLMEREEARREREMDYWESTCDRIERNYERAAENAKRTYERECKAYDKMEKKIASESQKRCMVCKGDGKRTCGYCHGKGCRSKSCAGGRTVRSKCGHCNGTGHRGAKLKMPKLPREKHVKMDKKPKRPSWPPLSATDWRHEAEEAELNSPPARAPLPPMEVDRPMKPGHTAVLYPFSKHPGTGHDQRKQ